MMDDSLVEQSGNASKIFPLNITTKLVITLGVEGVQLLSPAGTAPLILKFHELFAISELSSREYLDQQQEVSRVTARTGAQEEDVQKFLRVLANSGRLLRRRRSLPTIDLKPASVPRTRKTLSLDRGLILLKLPLALRICASKFQLINHDGCLLIEFSAAELVAVSQYTQPTAFSDGVKNQRELLAEHSCDESRLVQILTCLEGAGLVSNYKTGDSEYKEVKPQQTLKERFSQQAAQLD